MTLGNLTAAYVATTRKTPAREAGVQRKECNSGTSTHVTLRQEFGCYYCMPDLVLSRLIQTSLAACPSCSLPFEQRPVDAARRAHLHNLVLLRG